MRSAVKSQATDWTTRRALRLGTRIVVPIALVTWLLAFQVSLTPDLVFLCLVILFVAYGNGWEFIRRFSPFVGLLATYDALRGVVPYVSKHVHYTLMYDFDRWLGFGTIPTIRLQHALNAGPLHWYDRFFFGLYTVHFLTPVLLGILIWRLRDASYWRYMWSFVVLSYGAFLTYLAFPAAPPWMASRDHYIPYVEPVQHHIWNNLSVHSVPNLYEMFGPNQVAAVPSLHSAYPTLIALFVFELFGRRWGLLAMIYPISMWIGVMYLGEHYLFDVLAGALYAVISFVLVKWLVGRWDARRDRRRMRTLELPDTPAALSERRQVSMEGSTR
jgi:membrane-associated phospholipid phosphatase